MYRLIEHTADLRIEVTGATREALFENCALAVADLLTDPERIKAASSKTLMIAGLDPVDLLINFLREVLYLFNGEGFLIKAVRILDLSDTRLQADLTGDTFDPVRHALRTEIKAVTYHQACIQQNKNKWIARVLFDV
jgi:SHS2 domain-containing protein